MKFGQLLSELETKQGCNLAEVAIGRMMDMIEERTGKWPSWNDEAPEWVLKASNVKV